jgi:mannose-6-phosphate isomerase-like protein (cupin superfamily)
MQIFHSDPTATKGWSVGPWNSGLPIAIGYANAGIDEFHYHRLTTEIYLVARGTAQLQVKDQIYEITAGEVVIIEPGEPHTFTSSSQDYFHFVVHASALSLTAEQAVKISPPSQA